MSLVRSVLWLFVVALPLLPSCARPSTVPDAAIVEPEPDGGGEDPERDGGVTDGGHFLVTVMGTNVEHIQQLIARPEGGTFIIGTFDSPGSMRIGDVVVPDPSPPKYEWGETDGWVDSFVAAVDERGAVQWVRVFGAKDSLVVVNAAVRAEDGSVFVTGRYWGAPDFGNGPVPLNTGNPGYYLVKVVPSGETQWVLHTEMDANAGYPTVLMEDGGKVHWAVTHDHRMTIEGLEFDPGKGRAMVTLLTVTSDGEIEGSATVGDPDSGVTLLQLARGEQGSRIYGFAAIGRFRFGGETIDMPAATHVLVKVDATGRHQWHKFFVHAADDLHLSRKLKVAVDPQGEIYVAGNRNGALRFGGLEYPAQASPGWPLYVARIGPAGEERWIRTSDADAGIDVPGFSDLDLTRLHDGGIAIALQHGSPVRMCGNESDVMNDYEHYQGIVSVLDANGHCRWAHATSIGQDNSVLAPRVAAGPDGELFLSGVVEGYWPYDGGAPCSRDPSLPCAQVWDAYVVRLTP